MNKEDFLANSPGLDLGLGLGLDDDDDGNVACGHNEHGITPPVILTPRTLEMLARDGPPPVPQPPPKESSEESSEASSTVMVDINAMAKSATQKQDQQDALEDESESESETSSMAQKLLKEEMQRRKRGKAGKGNKRNNKKKTKRSPGKGKGKPVKKPSSLKPTAQDDARYHSVCQHGRQILMNDVTKNLDSKFAKAAPRRALAGQTTPAVPPTAGGFAPGSIKTGTVPTLNLNASGTSIDLPRLEELAEQAALRKAEAEAAATGHCEALCAKENCNKKLLLVACCGMKDKDGNKLLDSSAAPWKTHAVKLAKKDHVAEVIRRGELKKLVDPSHRAPRPAQWSMDEIHKWQDDNPINCRVDVDFLSKELEKCRTICQAAADEKAEIQSKKVETRSPPWSLKAWLRFLIASVQDNAKKAFETKDDALDGDELDARNHEDRPLNFIGITIKNALDPNQVYETDALPDLHHSFASVLTLTADDMPKKEISVEEGLKRWNYCKAAVTLTSRDWEASGKGFGSPRDPDDPDFGRLDETTLLEAGDKRKNFLGKHREHALCFWHLLDQQEILADVCCNLDEAIAICSGEEIGEVSTSDTTTANDSKKIKEGEEQLKIGRNLSNSMDSIAYDSAEKRLAESRKELREIKREQRQCEVASDDWEDLEKERKAVEETIRHQDARVTHMRQMQVAIMKAALSGSKKD